MNRPSVLKQSLPTPHDFRYWRTKLAKANLPVGADSQQAVLAVMARPTTTNQHIANAIIQDPVLTLKVLMKANRRLASQQTEVSGILHAVSLLGANAVEQLVQRSETFTTEDVAREPHYRGYALALQQSLFAAHLNKALHKRKGEHAANQAYLTALLANAYQWAMWQIAPEHTVNLRGLSLNTSLAFQQVEALGFGCPLWKLFKATINAWSLPDTLRQAADLPPRRCKRFLARSHVLTDSDWWDWRDYNPEARQLAQQSYWPALLCNFLVESAYHNWFSRHTLRWQKLLGRLLTLQCDEVIAICHKVAAEMNSDNSLPISEHPAYRLLGHYELAYMLPAITPVQDDFAEATEEEPLTTQRAISWQRYRNDQLLSAAKQRLKFHGARFANIHQLIHVAVDALRDGLGMEQVAVLNINHEQQLQTRYCAGIDTAEPLRALSVGLQKPLPPLLAQLLQKPAGLLITPEQYPKLRKALPARFADAVIAARPVTAATLSVPTEQYSCVLASIFLRNKPFAILCIRAPHINSNDYDQCREVGQLIGVALAGFASRKSTPSQA